MSENAKKSLAPLIIAAWLLVSLPLAWGIYNTALSSAKLFQSAPATSAK